MTAWWEIDTPQLLGAVPKFRAVAYYRHSAQDRQENSIPIQRDQVREWAEKNGVEIIREFADAGKSGLTSEGRPAFTEMMDEWVKKRNDFSYILCLDVSRWGRFQDIDLSAQFSAECKKHNKQVIYTTIGKPREDDPLYPVYVQFERFRAAQYSRELSDKVWRGCVKITEQGYWAGGSPPYGTRRLLLDEKREPLHQLEPGQRKGIQNQRVTLVEGDPLQVAVIQRIFHEFVDFGYSEYKIAEGLNADGILSPSGRRWGAGSILGRLQNETYIGTLVYNKTPQKLKTPRRDNRMVNQLSASQEMRMLRKSLEELDEKTIANALGMSGIRHRLNISLMDKLDASVVKAFEASKLNLQCAKELAHVKSERQAEILKLMESCNDYSVTFARGLVLKTPVAKRAKLNGKRTPWTQADEKKNDLLKKLREAEQQQDFYSGLYRQYTTNLLKLVIFVRTLVANPRLKQFLRENHPQQLEVFEQIINSTER